MLQRFNQFITEAVQKDNIKDYFYDLIDSGAQYNFNPLPDGGFYIIIFNYQNINDGKMIKNGKINEKFLESLISRINHMENLDLTYSIMKRLISKLSNGQYNAGRSNVIIIFDSYFVDHFKSLFKDLRVSISPRGEDIFSKNNHAILSHSSGLISILDVLWAKMTYQRRQLPFSDAIIARIMYEVYGLKVNFVNATHIIPPIDNGRLNRMLIPPRYIAH